MYLLNIIIIIPNKTININMSNTKLNNKRSCNGLVMSVSKGLPIKLGSGLYQVQHVENF